MMGGCALAALWILVLSRVPRVLRGGDAVLAAALPAAVAATVALTPLQAAVDDAVEVPRASLLLEGTLLILAFGLFRNAVVKAVARPSTRNSMLRRGLLHTSVAATVFIVAFLCAGKTGALGGGYGPDSGAFVFATALCGFLACVAVDVALICARYVPRMASPLYRVGFSGVAAGCVVAFLALIAAEVQQVMILLSARPEVVAGLAGISSALGGVASILITVGLILPSLSHSTQRLSLGTRFRLLQLDGLWRRAARLRPALVLDPQAAPARGAFADDPRRHLHRTLVEIHDCDFSTGGRFLTRRRLRIVSKAEEALND